MYYHNRPMRPLVQVRNVSKFYPRVHRPGERLRAFAALLAGRLAAERLEIWTDVPGIFSADPRVVPEARLLRRLSYSEAQELASMGARVLHPPSIQPARRHAIPVSHKAPPGQPLKYLIVHSEWLIIFVGILFRLHN